MADPFGFPFNEQLGVPQQPEERLPLMSPTVQPGVAGLLPGSADQVVTGQAVSPFYQPKPLEPVAGLSGVGAARSFEELSAATAPRAPSASLAYNPVSDQYYINGRVINAANALEVEEGAKFIGQGGPALPPGAPNWQPISEYTYRNYLETLKKPRTVGENIALGTKSLAARGVAGIGRAAQIAGATEAGPAIAEFAEERIGPTKEEQARTALIDKSNSFWRNVLDASAQGSSSLAASLIGGVGGFLIGGPIGAGVGAGLVSLLPNISAMWDSAKQNKYDVNDPGVQAQIIGGALGVSALDAIPIGRGAKHIFSPAAKEAAEKAGQNVFRKALTGARRGSAEEAVTEAMQEIVQSVWFDPQVRSKLWQGDIVALAPYVAQNYGREALVAGGAGAILGGIFGGGAAALGGRRGVDTGEPKNVLADAGAKAEGAPAPTMESLLSPFEALPPADQAGGIRYAPPLPGAQPGFTQLYPDLAPQSTAAPASAVTIPGITEDFPIGPSRGLPPPTQQLLLPPPPPPPRPEAPAIPMGGPPPVSGPVINVPPSPEERATNAAIDRRFAGTREDISTTAEDYLAGRVNPPAPAPAPAVAEVITPPISNKELPRVKKERRKLANTYFNNLPDDTRTAIVMAYGEDVGVTSPDVARAAFVKYINEEKTPDLERGLAALVTRATRGVDTREAPLVQQTALQAPSPTTVQTPTGVVTATTEGVVPPTAASVAPAPEVGPAPVPTAAAAPVVEAPAKPPTLTQRKAAIRNYYLDLPQDQRPAFRNAVRGKEVGDMEFTQWVNGRNTVQMPAIEARFAEAKQQQQEAPPAQAQPTTQATPVTPAPKTEAAPAQEAPAAGAKSEQLKRGQKQAEETARNESFAAAQARQDAITAAKKGDPIEVRAAANRALAAAERARTAADRANSVSARRNADDAEKHAGAAVGIANQEEAAAEKKAAAEKAAAGKAPAEKAPAEKAPAEKTAAETAARDAALKIISGHARNLTANKTNAERYLGRAKQAESAADAADYANNARSLANFAKEIGFLVTKTFNGLSLANQKEVKGEVDAALETAADVEKAAAAAEKAAADKAAAEKAAADKAPAEKDKPAVEAAVKKLNPFAKLVHHVGVPTPNTRGVSSVFLFQAHSLLNKPIVVPGYVRNGKVYTFSGSISNVAVQTAMSRDIGDQGVVNALVTEGERLLDEVIVENAKLDAANPDGPFTAGKSLVFSNNVPKATRSFVEAVFKELNLTGRRLLVLSDKDLESAETEFSLYGGRGAYLRALQSAALDPNTFGAHAGGILFVRDTDSKLKLVTTLAHELGHYIKDTAFKDASAATQAAVKNAFLRWQTAQDVKLKRGKTETDAKQKEIVQEIVDSLRGPAGLTGAEITIPESRAVEAVKEKSSYWLGESEWFADQIKKALIAKAAPGGGVRPTTLVEQFFAGVAGSIEKLINVWKKFTGQQVTDSLAVPEIEAFVDGMRNSANKTPGPDPTLVDMFRSDLGPASAMTTTLGQPEARAAVEPALNTPDKIIDYTNKNLGFLPGPIREASQNVAINLLEAAKRGVYGMSFGNDLVSQITKHLPSARQFFDVLTTASSVVNEANEARRNIYGDLDALKIPQRREVFKIGLSQTSRGKWGYEPEWLKGRLDAKGNPVEIKIDPVAKAEWDKFKAANPKGAAVLDRMFEHMYNLDQRLRTTVRSLVEADLTTEEYNALSPEDKAKRRADVATRLKMFDVYGRIQGPYLPMSRFGEYIVVARSKQLQALEAIPIADRSKEEAEQLAEMRKDADHYDVRFFPSKATAVKARREIQAAYPDHDVVDFNKISEIKNLKDEASRTLLTLRAALKENVGTTEEAKKAEAALDDAIMSLYVRGLAESSARRRKLPREGVAGVNPDDMPLSFDLGSQSLASFIDNMTKSSELAPILEQLREEASVMGDSQKALNDKRRAEGLPADMQVTSSRDDRTRAMRELMLRHVDGVAQPPTGRLTEAITTATATYLLTTLPRYYIMNGTQPAMMLQPKLAARFGQGASWTAMKHAYQGMLQSIKTDEGGFYSGKFDITKLKTYDPLTKTYKNISGGLLAAIEAARDRSLLDVGLGLELAHFRSHGFDAASATFNKVMHKLTNLSRRVEYTNRVVTVVASFNLKMAQLLKDNPGIDQKSAEKQAIDYAIEMLRTTQGDPTRENMPRYFSKVPGGKVILQFRTFQALQASEIIRHAYNMFKHADPQERQIARAALGYLMLNTAVMSGAVGIPGVALAAYILGAAFGDDEDLKYSVGSYTSRGERALREALGDNAIANILIKGIPTGFGIDVGAQLGMGNTFSLLPYTDMDLSSKEGYNKMVVGMLGPFASIGSNFADGFGMIHRGDYWKGTELMLPTGFRAAMRAYRETYADGVTTRAGDQLVSPEEFNFLKTVVNGLGIPTTDMQKIRDTRRDIYDFDVYFKDRTSTLRRQFVEARKDRDVAAQEDIKGQWRELQAAKQRVGFKPTPLSSLLLAPTEQARREKRGQEQFRRVQEAQ